MPRNKQDQQHHPSHKGCGSHGVTNWTLHHPSCQSFQNKHRHSRRKKQEGGSELLRGIAALLDKKYNVENLIAITIGQTIRVGFLLTVFIKMNSTKKIGTD
jgi:hypothetical protein